MTREVKTAFVAMPSGRHEEYSGGAQESDFIYQDIICPALINVFGEDIHIIREADNRNPGAITRELIHHLIEADVCVVDVTGLNPNVFLELGIRYALRRSVTVLLRQTGTNLPFDITDYRCVDYSPLYKGPAKAIADVTETLRAAVSRPSHDADSLVFNILPDLSVDWPGVIGDDERGSAPGIMPWRDYWQRLEIVVQKLHDVVRDGVFTPQAVLGISNGGLVYADLLGRHLFNSVPILSLWADRNNKDGNYFDNPVNDAVLQGIASRDAASKLILLVDDIVASGTTLKQATNYLSKKLPDWKVCFLPLFSRNEKYMDIVREHLVWFAPALHLSEREALDIHAAEKMILPYKKEIRST